MSRPTAKPELERAASEQFEKMWKLIDSMPESEQNAPFSFVAEGGHKEAHWKRDKNLRDVLIHLYEWHQLLINWIESNRRGEATPFLPAPYNWKTYSEMNVAFCEKHCFTAYADAKKILLDSHKKVLKLVGQFSDAELFNKQYFSWTGTSSLGSYCVSATASHYDWAMKKIKLHVANCGKKR